MLLRLLHKQSQVFNIFFLVTFAGVPLNCSPVRNTLSVASAPSVASIMGTASMEEKGAQPLKNASADHSIAGQPASNIFVGTLTTLKSYVGLDVQNSDEPYQPNCPRCDGSPDTTGDAGTRNGLKLG